MHIISVPWPLREKLGEDGSEALVNLLNHQSDSVEGDVIKIAEEKFERRLSDEMAKMNERITIEIAKVNERITIEISKVNDRITTEIGKVNERITEESRRLQTNLIKWMFIFWIGQFGMMLGFFLTFIK